MEPGMCVLRFGDVMSILPFRAHGLSDARLIYARSESGPARGVGGKKGAKPETQPHYAEWQAAMLTSGSLLRRNNVRVVLRISGIATREEGLKVCR